MLKRIMRNEYVRISRDSIEGSEILESEKRIGELLKKIKSIDSEVFHSLDSEIGTNISLHSRNYFNIGFKLGLKLATEIEDVTVK